MCLGMYVCVIAPGGQKHWVPWTYSFHFSRVVPAHRLDSGCQHLEAPMPRTSLEWSCSFQSSRKVTFLPAFLLSTEASHGQWPPTCGTYAHIWPASCMLWGLHLPRQLHALPFVHRMAAPGLQFWPLSCLKWKGFFSLGAHCVCDAALEIWNSAGDSEYAAANLEEGYSPAPLQKELCSACGSEK